MKLNCLVIFQQKELDMPIYEYQCKSCGYEFEEVQRFSDPAFDECPSCTKSSAVRKVSISSFHLKGGGWYKDGYSNKKLESEQSVKTEKEKDSSKKLGESNSGESQKKTEKKESVPNKKSTSSKKEKAA